RVAYAPRFDHRVHRAWTGNHRRTRAPRQPLPHRRLPPRLGRGPPACAAAPRCDPSRGDVRAPARIAASSTRWATAPTNPMRNCALECRGSTLVLTFRTLVLTFRTPHSAFRTRR